MYSRLTLVLLLAATPVVSLTQPGDQYTVPRTAHGHPDLQGVWVVSFVTPFERFEDVDALVASPEEAQALVKMIQARRPDNIDPEVDWQGITDLAVVRGEYRTSVIVDPADGRMPLTPAGLELAEQVQARNTEGFAGPEQLPLRARCMEPLSYAPMRTAAASLFHQVLQNRDHVAIVSEDIPGVRIIHLGEVPLSEALRSMEGHAAGHWDGDTLVVETTHLRAADPSRIVLGGRPVVLSRDTRIVERFTRVSDTELEYRFTIEDDTLYTAPWTGEYSMTRDDGPLYEYSCHEGNRSMAMTLRGARVEERAQLAPARR